MNIFEKIANIMHFPKLEDGKCLSDQFDERGYSPSDFPEELIVDVCYYGSITEWAVVQPDIESEKELLDAILNIIRRTITSPQLMDRKTRGVFPPIENFYYFCTSLQRRGKEIEEAKHIANHVWIKFFVPMIIKKKIDTMFNEAPSDVILKKASKKMKEIWNLTDKDVDALAFFVNQCKIPNMYPSLNKAIFFYGQAQQTGKTTLARAFTTVLNGDVMKNFGKYHSKFRIEMGFGNHDFPLACYNNCVLLDDSIPKDTRKTFGDFKSELTNNVFIYNPKHRDAVTLPAKRNYFITSNDKMMDFIQGKSERRIYGVHFEKKPKQIPIDDIYSIVKDFCQNVPIVTEEEKIKEWYNSFEHVTGYTDKEMEEVLQDMILHKSFYETSGTVTARQIASNIFKNEPTRDQKNVVEMVLNEHFVDAKYKSNLYSYSKPRIFDKLRDLECKQLEEFFEEKKEAEEIPAELFATDENHVDDPNYLPY